MAARTLRADGAGGIHDHVGGGFHRYSVDEDWFVPHFEKMLYDQAQIAVSALEAWQATGDERHAWLARDIARLRPAGPRASRPAGFYSAEDADSDVASGRAQVRRRLLPLDPGRDRLRPFSRRRRPVPRPLRREAGRQRSRGSRPFRRIRGKEHPGLRPSAGGHSPRIRPRARGSGRPSARLPGAASRRKGEDGPGPSGTRRSSPRGTAS